MIETALYLADPGKNRGCSISTDVYYLLSDYYAPRPAEGRSPPKAVNGEAGRGA